MKTFSFRLEKLLKLKERFESLKLQAHEEARMRVADQEANLERLLAEKESHTAKEREKLSGSVDVNQLRAYSRYFHHLHLENLAGIDVRNALEVERLGKREELVAAARERKSLEEYKDKLRIRHEREAEKAERAELDEIAAQRFVYDRHQAALRRTDVALSTKLNNV